MTFGSEAWDETQLDQPLAFSSPKRGTSDSQNSSRESSKVGKGALVRFWGG